VEDFCDAGADIVTVHVESDKPENIFACLHAIHKKGKRCGIVLKPATPAQAASEFVRYCDMVLVMTVEPGFGGQSFMFDHLEKIQALRAMIQAENPSCELEVDGGVDAETAPLCIQAGANVLVAGSAVYKSENIPEAIRRIRGNG
jgi:ribulose-phosphate 3-epimerase